MNKSFLVSAAMLAWLVTMATEPPIRPSTSRDESTRTHLIEQAPIEISEVAPGVFLVDFGRVAFGNLSLSLGGSTGAANEAANDEVRVRFGEALKNGRVDTQPPGSVRYAEVKVRLNGTGATRVAPPADARNTKPPAVLTPPDWGVLLPFRWVEVEGWPGELHVDEIRRLAAFDSTWNDEAAAFQLF